MSGARPWQPATIAAQAAGRHSPGGGVVGPIETSTTFERDAAYGLPGGDVYRRDHNATVREAEAVIAALEEAAEARLFASGIAAIAALMRSAGGPVVLQSGTYYGTAVLARDLSAERTVLGFDPADLGTLEAACREYPALVFVETPSNPFLAVVDIAEAAAIAHRAGAVLAVDSTAATPILTRPLALGADVVVHSATKGLNGHSDVLAGALAVADPALPVWQAVATLRGHEGAVASPFDAYLLTRGMRTVHLRVAAASRAALHLAQWLDAHPAVRRVRYPGLAGHPNHALAARQMTGGFGGLLSFELADAEAARAAVGRLALIKRATSLGGVETLIEHRHSIEPAFTGVPPGLLRLSVGIEAVEDLVADLDQALAPLAP